MTIDEKVLLKFLKKNLSFREKKKFKDNSSDELDIKLDDLCQFLR